MKRLRYSITINSPKEKVWKTMLEDATYRIWSEVFMKGSHFTGDWSEGSKMLFLAPDECGKTFGMVSLIRKNRLYEFISIEHLGFLKDGVEDTTSPEVKAFAGAQENYTFTEKDRRTEVLVELDTVEEYAGMFEDTWPRALEKLKELAEA
ncbi:MAG: SRPBCC domain-containing protein [Acidobacteriota bacterium]|nr:MAG: SRPBCC domain-containing protein [Acidobacteriota bacterium]